MTPWLSIVGIGEDGLEGMAPAARALVAQATVLIGGDRHLALVPDDTRERLTWPSPLSDLIPEIVSRRGQAVCVLASGDPLFYGIGVTLARSIPPEEMTIVPAPSAFSLACARLGWDRAAVDTLTLHGRPLALLQPFIQPDARLLVLSEDGYTPARVAEALVARGYGESRLTVLEHMGGPRERQVEGRAAAWGDRRTADLNTLAIECVADPGTPLLPRVPGLPDDAFRHDGQMTKREVRAVTLSALAPVPGQLLWDVGAGCGSIAIEWLRAVSRSRAIAVERKPERLALIADNATALGTPELSIVPGVAPAALEGLEAPDAVFLGGGVSQPGLIEACWLALKPGGRLVANAVTLEGEARLIAWRQSRGGTLTRISVERSGPVGDLHAWRPLMTVVHYAGQKA